MKVHSVIHVGLEFGPLENKNGPKIMDETVNLIVELQKQSKVNGKFQTLSFSTRKKVSLVVGRKLISLITTTKVKKPQKNPKPLKPLLL